MELISIACINKNMGIGKNGKLLYRIPEDLEFFKELTYGNTVIFGRKTLETFPNGLPLNNRRNIVLSKTLKSIPDKIKNSVNYCSIIGKSETGILMPIDIYKEDNNKNTSLFVVDDIEDLSHLLNLIIDPDSKVFIIGGESIYKQFIPYCTKAILTIVDSDLEADAFFPNILNDKNWEIESKNPFRSTPNGLRYQFVTYKNLKVNTL